MTQFFQTVELAVKFLEFVNKVVKGNSKNTMTVSLTLLFVLIIFLSVFVIGLEIILKIDCVFKKQPGEVFCKNFTGKHLRWGLIFKKVAGLQACNVIKIDSSISVLL